MSNIDLSKISNIDDLKNHYNELKSDFNRLKERCERAEEEYKKNKLIAKLCLEYKKINSSNNNSGITEYIFINTNVYCISVFFCISCFFFF